MHENVITAHYIVAVRRDEIAALYVRENNSRVATLKMRRALSLSLSLSARRAVRTKYKYYIPHVHNQKNKSIVLASTD